jgi:uncharacterized protein
MPGVPGGNLILVDGATAGAFMDLDAGHVPPGMTPSIGVLVHAPSADASVAKAIALGGAAGPAFDVMQNGRMAMCKDPIGGSLGLWQPKSKVGFECDRRAIGAASWFSLVGKEALAVKDFYCSLFGWTADSAAPANPQRAYAALNHSLLAGFTSEDAAPPQWNTYFNVANLGSARDRALALNAKDLGPIDVHADVGKSLQLTSPQGVQFHVIERFSA